MNIAPNESIAPINTSVIQCIDRYITDIITDTMTK